MGSDRFDQYRFLQTALPLAIGLSLAALMVLSYTRNINWDEFYFLSHVHAYLEGALDRPMQTFYVRGFAWLGNVPGDEIMQIRIGRVAMLAFVGVTILTVYYLSRHVTDENVAGLAVLGFLTSGFVLPHATSFRADPIAAALLMIAFSLMMTTQMRLWQVLIVALCTALAGLVTIKAALYAPVFLGAILWRWPARGVCLRILLAGAVTVVFFVVLYSWHASGINTAAGNDTATDLTDAARTTVLRSGLFPRAAELLTWAILSLPILVLVVLGFFGARQIRIAIALILFAGPILATVVYRNAFPYFFPFAVPPLIVIAALGAVHLSATRRIQILILMLATGAAQIGLSIPERIAPQAATIAEVHRLFARPVPYISDNNIMASFPSTGFFMSSWGVGRYRAEGKPKFASIIAQDRPPLLIAAKPALIDTMVNNKPVLLPEDHAILRQSYVHYAGTIWLAGGSTVIGNDDAVLKVPFPGRYRVETEGNIRIHGVEIGNGAVLDLDTGPQRISGKTGTAVKLIWDTGVQPINTPLPRDIYAGFWTISFW